MEKTANPRVKICCISSIEEAWIAIRCGASALGLVSQMPSGPGVISEELIAKIAVCVPPPIATFLLTSSLEVKQVAPFGLDLCSAVRTNGKLDENKLKLFFQQLK